MEKIATLEEIERHWSLADVARANNACDMIIEAENARREKQESDG